jgi:diadenosine tetraphosphate (Ap4A) HIT family hydrolase
MPLVLLSCAGGDVVLPDAALVLVDRVDGGNLVVNPPRPVWDRSALAPEELARWSALVAAAGAAMLESLPQLHDGCLNYWDAGNWALNAEAPPIGPKTGPEHRQLHLHLLGRSRQATDPDFRWGEAPRFPDYADRIAWAAPHARLTPGECLRVVRATQSRLHGTYGFTAAQVGAWRECTGCAYPFAHAAATQDRCPECRNAGG